MASEAFAEWLGHNRLGVPISLHDKESLLFGHLELLKREISFDVQQIEREFEGRARGINLEWAITENLDFRASSSFSDEGDFIALPLGLILQISRLFVSVGKQGMSLLVPDPHPSSTPPEWLKQVDASQLMTGMGAFDGLSRQQVSETIHAINIAVRYIFHHELAHIWNGHLEWLSKCSLTKEAIKADENLRTQNSAFEFDADTRAGWAARRLLTASANITISDDNGENPFRFTIFSTYYRHLEGCTTFEIQTFRYISSIYLVIRLSMMLIGEHNENDLHPPPLCRLLWFIGGAIKTYAYSANQMYEITKDIIFNAALIAEKEFCVVTQQPNLDIFSSQNIDRALELREVLKKSWNECRPALEKYNRGINLFGYGSSETDIISQELNEISAGSARRRSAPEMFDINVSRYAQRLIHSTAISLPETPEHICSQTKQIIELCIKLDKFMSTTVRFRNRNSPILWIRFLQLTEPIFQILRELCNNPPTKRWANIINTLIDYDMLLSYIRHASTVSLTSQLACIGRSKLNKNQAKLATQLGFVEIIDENSIAFTQSCLNTPSNFPLNAVAPSEKFSTVLNDHPVTVEGAIRASYVFFSAIQTQLLKRNELLRLLDSVA